MISDLNSEKIKLHVIWRKKRTSKGETVKILNDDIHRLVKENYRRDNFNIELNLTNIDIVMKMNFIL